MIELLMLWFAFSIRNPNIEPNPFDYEISTGYNTEISFIKSDAKIIYERENGNNYNGRIHNHDFKYLLLGEYVKTAKDISNQKIALKYPFKRNRSTLNVGLVTLLNKYQYDKTTAYMSLKTPYVEMELAGLVKVEMFKSKLKYTYNLGGGVFIEPALNIYYKDEFDYQGKIKIGYKWKKLMK